MKKLIRFAGVFLVLALLLSVVRALVFVSMNGWQFIILVLVLAGIAEYFIEKH